MTRANRKVIQISTPLHDRLSETKRERELELSRQVSFSEIIDQWRIRALGLDMLAAHAVARPEPERTP